MTNSISQSVNQPVRHQPPIPPSVPHTQKLPLRVIRLSSFLSQKKNRMKPPSTQLMSSYDLIHIHAQRERFASLRFNQIPKKIKPNKKNHIHQSVFTTIVYSQVYEVCEVYTAYEMYKYLMYLTPYSKNKTLRSSICRGKRGSFLKSPISRSISSVIPSKYQFSLTHSLTHSLTSYSTLKIEN